jgi:hypothetical protein
MDAILQTLVGGVLALAGAFVGPHFHRKHERWRASREDRHILREKAQELFDELDRMIKESQAASISAISRLEGGSDTHSAVPDLGRIRAIAAIYFPSSLGLIDSFEEEHRKLSSEIYDILKDALNSGEKGLGILRGLPMVVTTNYQQFASRFVSEMRSHLVDNVPKMELENVK